MTIEKPNTKPNNPNFSSGPCSKRPGWTINALSDALTGRSHRSAEGKAKLKEVIEKHRELLKIPSDYKIGIVPASDTGAFEMAMWSLLDDDRGVDIFSWESFGKGWATDIQKHLKLENVHHYEATYGQLPDMTQANEMSDIVFTWNGTTSGVRVPNMDWLPQWHTGLTLCDATSAVFAYDMPWDKLDVTTWSWQKVLGGEAAHGMIVLSPDAVKRLENYTPIWPMPKIFRMTKGHDLIEGIFQGETINTPSMIAVEDCLDALNWVKSIGGLDATIKRSQDNFNAIESWVAKTPWVHFLAQDELIRSTTSICLTLDTVGDEKPFVKDMVKLLDSENVAKDINAYRDAPAGLRIWGGATVETSDITAMLPWIEWAYKTVKQQNLKKNA